VDVRERVLPDLEQRLARLKFRPDDLADAVRVLPEVLADDAACERAAVLANRIRANVGDYREWRVMPVFEEQDEVHPLGKGLVPIVALLATVDDVRAHQATRGIPDELTLDTCGDLGQQVLVHRLRDDAFGLHNQGWLNTVWRGSFTWLGRLQYHLDWASFDGEHHEWALSCHIPMSGPLRPDEVEESFARAFAFYAEHFPDYPVRRILTHSWLADPTLSQLLPATSNMAVFQRRWTPFGTSRAGDRDAIYFTFRRPEEVNLDTLPQDTTLQRAIVGHLKGGGHFSVCSGYVDRTELT